MGGDAHWRTSEQRYLVASRRMAFTFLGKSGFRCVKCHFVLISNVRVILNYPPLCSTAQPNLRPIVHEGGLGGVGWDLWSLMIHGGGLGSKRGVELVSHRDCGIRGWGGGACGVFVVCCATVCVVSKSRRRQTTHVCRDTGEKTRVSIFVIQRCCSPQVRRLPLTVSVGRPLPFARTLGSHHTQPHRRSHRTPPAVVCRPE